MISFVTTKTIEIVDHIETGRKFAELRQGFGLTQQQVAERCGISIGHVSCLERGRRNWTKQTIEDMAKTLEELAGSRAE